MGGAGATLSADDRRLLDALVEHGFDASALEPSSGVDKLRVQKLAALFQLLHDYPVEDADDTLLDATMARISRHDASREDRMKLDPQTAAAAIESTNARKRFLRVPLPDFITIAAVLLIAAGVGWPLLSGMRQKSLDAACANNLRKMAIAFKDYAADYDNRMPTAQAGLHNAWSRLAHNVVNLQPLVEGGYCDLGHMNCPGHKGDVGESFSYQWQSADEPMRWETARVNVVLGDRNPLIDAARRGSYASPLTLSLSHGGRGQNVLWTDGATIWLDEPIVGRADNIWLPDGAQRLIDGLRTKSAADAFLAH